MSTMELLSNLQPPLLLSTVSQYQGRSVAASRSPTGADDFDLSEYILEERIDGLQDPALDMPDPSDLDSFFAELMLPVQAPRPYSPTPLPTALRSTAPAGPTFRQVSQTVASSPTSSQSQPQGQRGRPRKASDSTENASTCTRRERNRQAAQRCRERRQARVDELEAEIELLRTEREAMLAELVRLGARPPQ